MSGKTRIGMVTVGQAPRADILPDMAALLPDVDNCSMPTPLLNSA